MKYYIECKYDTVTYQDDFNRDDWSGFDHDAMINHKFKVWKKPISYPDETLETDLEDPHFVIVIYGDGGTFGHTDGYTQYLPPMTSEQAHKVAEIIKDGPKDIVEALKEVIELPKYWYPRWQGYFSNLEQVLILRDDGYIKEV